MCGQNRDDVNRAFMNLERFKVLDKIKLEEWEDECMNVRVDGAAM